MVGNRFFGNVLSPSKSGALDISEFDRWMLPEQQSAAFFWRIFGHHRQGGPAA
jgi:hypothetical protein